jgi:ABC-type glutathione transport system ATPase component
MGPSGSGKSTLLRCVAGVEPMDGGRVAIDGIDIRGLRDNALTKLRRERIGFVFQSFNLMPALTAAENVALPLRLAGLKPDPAKISQALADVGLDQRARHCRSHRDPLFERERRSPGQAPELPIVIIRYFPKVPGNPCPGRRAGLIAAPGVS